MVKLALFVVFGCLIGAVLGYFGKCTSGACPFTANPFRGAGFGALFGLLFGLSSSGTLFGNRQPSAPDSEAIVKIQDAAGLDSLLASSPGPVLVDFHADWCGPCRRLAPEISALADQWKGRASIVKINVDHHPDIATRFKVQSIPDIRVFAGGIEKERLTGFRTRDQLNALLLSASAQ